MFARLADAFKRKTDATKFEVTLRLHTLSPWPSSAKFKRLGVRWQRGGKVRRRLPLPPLRARAAVCAAVPDVHACALCVTAAHGHDQGGARCGRPHGTRAGQRLPHEV
jgi:hypothetical protein